MSETRQANVYLDANGGVGLSQSVHDAWSKIASCTNPSNALARAGKETAVIWEESERGILRKLTADPGKWKLIAISGSTEGIISSIMNGTRTTTTDASYNRGDEDGSVRYDGRILCLRGNHPCVEEIAERWPQLYGTNLRLDYCDTSLPAVETALTSDDRSYAAIFITHVASLTGMITDCARISSSFRRRSSNGLVIVDGTQAIGKVKPSSSTGLGWTVEGTGADVYIFSGHKFGALKGIGGMLIRKTILPRWMPFIPGSQQDSLRGGTLNVQGLLSMDLALSDTVDGLSSKIEKTKKCVAKMCRLIEAARLPRVRIVAPLDVTKESERSGKSGKESEREVSDYTWNTILLSVPLCSRRIATGLCNLGYDVGIGTACQQAHPSDASKGKRDHETAFQIRISLLPGQAIDEEKFVVALREAFGLVLKAILAENDSEQH